MERKLSWLDQFLWLWILLAMALGLLLGYYVPSARDFFGYQFMDNVSLPIFLGLLIMMYPILCKVQYEELGHTLNKRLIKPFAVSFILNWIIGPLLMTALAWMTLPDLPGYRIGVIMVGLARCIAMVLIWNVLSEGDEELCALLVAWNSILQIILYSPYSYLFVNVMGGDDTQAAAVSFWMVAKNVLLYLGVPLVAAVLTRLGIRNVCKQRTLYDTVFIPWVSPIALLGLLFTIVAMFTLQGDMVIKEITSVLRVIVPLLLYFSIMFFGTFFACAFWLDMNYPQTVTQSFTAASNNFELAIAVCIGVWGVQSEQALAAVVGPLIEVPLMIALVYVAKDFRTRFFKGEGLEDKELADEEQGKKGREQEEEELELTAATLSRDEEHN
jgi:ACR3 family arsenite transporter